MKRIIKIFIVFILAFLVTGCGDKVKYHSNLTEQEVYDIANNFISEWVEPSTYKLNIVKTEPLSVCVFSWNVCHTYKEVRGGKQYTVVLTNKRTGFQESQVIVEDKYYRDGIVVGGRVTNNSVMNNYEFYLSYEKIVNLLEKYSSIHYKFKNVETDPALYKVVLEGFIYSTNVDELESFLKELCASNNDHWDFLITNDINEYNDWLSSRDELSIIAREYEKGTQSLRVDLSSFNDNHNSIIRNTSQGGRPCVNTVLNKKTA